MVIHITVFHFPSGKTYVYDSISGKYIKKYEGRTKVVMPKIKEEVKRGELIIDEVWK